MDPAQYNTSGSNRSRGLASKLHRLGNHFLFLADELCEPCRSTSGQAGWPVNWESVRNCGLPVVRVKLSIFLLNWIHNQSAAPAFPTGLVVLLAFCGKAVTMTLLRDCHSEGCASGPGSKPVL